MSSLCWAFNLWSINSESSMKMPPWTGTCCVLFSFFSKTVKKNSELFASFIFFRHLDFFEMKRNEDEREISKKFENVSLVTASMALFQNDHILWSIGIWNDINIASRVCTECLIDSIFRVSCLVIGISAMREFIGNNLYLPGRCFFYKYHVNSCRSMWTQRVHTQCLTSWERNWPWQAVISIWCPYYIIFSSSLVSFLLTSLTLVQFFKGLVWIKLNDGWGGFICQLTKLNFSSWKYDCCLLGFFILWKKIHECIQL